MFLYVYRLDNQLTFHHVEQNFHCGFEHLIHRSTKWLFLCYLIHHLIRFTFVSLFFVFFNRSERGFNCFIFSSRRLYKFSQPKLLLLHPREHMLEISGFRLRNEKMKNVQKQHSTCLQEIPPRDRVKYHEIVHLLRFLLRSLRN